MIDQSKNDTIHRFTKLSNISSSYVNNAKSSDLKDNNRFQEADRVIDISLNRESRPTNTVTKITTSHAKDSQANHRKESSTTNTNGWLEASSQTTEGDRNNDWSLDNNQRRYFVGNSAGRHDTIQDREVVNNEGPELDGKSQEKVKVSQKSHHFEYPSTHSNTFLQTYSAAVLTHKERLGKATCPESNARTEVGDVMSPRSDQEYLSTSKRSSENSSTDKMVQENMETPSKTEDAERLSRHRKSSSRQEKKTEKFRDKPIFKNYSSKLTKR